MNITYDAGKNAKNIAERGLSFDLVASMDFNTALVAIDERKEYGEVRYLAYGLIGERLHAVVFTATATGIRVISFRKANAREVKHYENQQ